MTDWIILRPIHPRQTISLARSLEWAAYDVWTPIEVQRKRRYGTKKLVEREVPIMPGFVFVGAHHLVEMVEIARAPTSPHPEFSMFTYLNRYPSVSDQSLDPLRMAERQAAPKDKAKAFEQGDYVKTPSGGFQGLTGQVVERSKGKFTLVCFGGFNIKIDTLLLLPGSDKSLAA